MMLEELAGWNPALLGVDIRKVSYRL